MIKIYHLNLFTDIVLFLNRNFNNKFYFNKLKKIQKVHIKYACYLKYLTVSLENYIFNL